MRPEPAGPHEHIWGEWMPYSQFEYWCQCVMPGCYANKREKAPRA